MGNLTEREQQVLAGVLRDREALAAFDTRQLGWRRDRRAVSARLDVQDARAGYVRTAD